MIRLRLPVLCAGALLAGGAVFVASAQDRTAQPGQPTQARVWIQNRGQFEAVPVSIVTSSGPVPVQVAGPSVVTTGPESVVTARAARQIWEYRDVRGAAAQELVVALSAVGQDGWEATGIAFQSAGQTVVIVKRPR
jgi:hypothetical protein